MKVRKRGEKQKEPGKREGTVDDAECCPGRKVGKWVADSQCGIWPWGQNSRGECRGAHLDPSERERPEL